MYYSWKLDPAQPRAAVQASGGRFGLLFESKDDIDQFVLMEITNPPMLLKVDVLCFNSDKSKHDEYLTKIFDVTRALLKANDHRRKYLKIEKEVIARFLKESLRGPNKHMDLTLDPIELNNELDGFLSQIKAAFDSLAITLNSIFGFHLDSWRKSMRKDGKVKKPSGYQILKNLESLPSTLKPKSKELGDLLTKNSGWLTYLSALRDMPVHQGGMKNVDSLVFEQKTRKVIAQRIFHPGGKSEDVGDFMTRTIKEVSQFISTFVLMCIVIKAPGGLVLMRMDDDKSQRYGWGIPSTAEATQSPPGDTPSQ